jgi:hypothetical protein
MKTRVLVSWAILEWMNGGKPADAFVAALLAEGEDAKARLLMSAINVVVTGDPEFRSVDKLKLDWIGRQ